jgi:hypothetical protein
VPVAQVDLDGLGYGLPRRSGSFELKFANLAAVWQSFSAVGASALVVSGLRALQAHVLAAAAAVPGSEPTVVVLSVTQEEQRERILARERSRYAVERGGGSSLQTAEALERFAAAAAQELEDEVEEIPGAVVLDTVGVPVVELARRLLNTTGWRAVARRA